MPPDRDTGAHDCPASRPGLFLSAGPCCRACSCCRAVLPGVFLSAGPCCRDCSCLPGLFLPPAEHHLPERSVRTLRPFANGCEWCARSETVRDSVRDGPGQAEDGHGVKRPPLRTGCRTVRLVAANAQAGPSDAMPARSTTAANYGRLPSQRQTAPAPENVLQSKGTNRPNPNPTRKIFGRPARCLSRRAAHAPLARASEGVPAVWSGVRLCPPRRRPDVRPMQAEAPTSGNSVPYVRSGRTSRPSGRRCAPHRRLRAPNRRDWW